MIKVISFFLLFLSIQGASAQRTIADVLKDQTRPIRENLRIAVEDSLGNRGYLPVSVIKGKEEGPIFTIMAGVHGFEYPPIMATQHLMREIQMDPLSGTLIVIPIANRGSFYSRTPFKNPKDGINLNNAFPGKANGTITQRLAHIISEKIIPVSDVFLDIHGGDAPEDLLPFVCYYDNRSRPEQTQKARLLSEISGFEYVVSYPYTLSDDEPAKYAFKQAVQFGKTALSIECGKLGNVQEKDVDLIKNGVYNMLAEMKMYRKRSAPITKVKKLNSQVYIRSKENGIFYGQYKAGDTVNKGDIIGRTTDEFGQVLSEYKAPVSGIVLYNLITPPINKGDTVMFISRFVEENR